MPRISGIRRYIRSGRTDSSVRRQVDDELAFHFAMRVDELVASGMTPEAARAEAEKRFGDVAAVRAQLARLDHERLGEERRADWWSALGQDARYAARGLRRSPVFTVGVILLVRRWRSRSGASSRPCCSMRRHGIRLCSRSLPHHCC